MILHSLIFGLFPSLSQISYQQSGLFKRNPWPQFLINLFGSNIILITCKVLDHNCSHFAETSCQSAPWQALRASYYKMNIRCVNPYVSFFNYGRQIDVRGTYISGRQYLFRCNEWRAPTVALIDILNITNYVVKFSQSSTRTLVKSIKNDNIAWNNEAFWLIAKTQFNCIVYNGALLNSWH